MAVNEGREPMDDATRAAAERDVRARARVRTELDRNFLVEAGAGSGKTTSLVERMVALVASGRAEMGNIAAVTFTRKAAAEMRGRFQLMLERESATAADPAVRARLDLALGRLEQCFIGTIHSFCSLLIRERPIEAGVDPEFEELDEAADAFMRRICWHEFLDEVRIGRPDILEKLDQAGLGASDLEEGYDRLADYPEADMVGGSESAPAVDDVRMAFDDFLAGVKRLMPGSRPGNGYDELQSLFRRLSWRSRNLDHTDIRVLMPSIALCDKNVKVTKNRWPSKDEANRAQTLFDEFQSGPAAEALRLWREFRHSAALALILPALEFYRARRRAASKLNFCDQLLVASAMLAGHPEVRCFFRERFRRILVDEFQDTDPVQAEILFYIAGTDENEMDWTKLAPAPGSLFLVGDPKQSIYRFRRADIDIYNQVREAIERTGGEVLKLTANFRSAPELVEILNGIFREPDVFPAAADAFQAAFIPLLARREAPDLLPLGFGRLMKMIVGRVPRHTGELIAAADAERTAAFITWALDSKMPVGGRGGKSVPVSPGDFLILFRYKRRMGLYAAELERRGIPYEVFGSEAFRGSREITELRRVLAFLADPADPVKAAAVMRGLFFGASDGDLLAFREAGGDFAALFPGPAPEGAPPTVKRTVETLRRWSSWTDGAPASLVLERIVEDSGLLVHTVTGERGDTRTGNVMKLVEMLRSFESRGLSSFRKAAAYLEERLEAGSPEEMGLSPGGGGVVRLMNLHKAKGLEAPVVILADPKGQTIHEPSSHVARLRQNLDGEGRPGQARAQGYFRLTRKSGHRDEVLCQSRDWEAKAEEEACYLAAEENRLMYVAATRARDLLVISAYEDDLGPKASWSVLDRKLFRTTDRPIVSALELPLIASQPASPAAVPPDIKPAVIAARAADLNRAKGGLMRAGSIAETVTGLARAGRAGVEKRSGDNGLKWGSAVHVLLDDLGRSWSGLPPLEDELTARAASALAAVELDAGRTGELAGYVGGMLDSDFWRRAMGAERTLFEVPFSLVIGPDDSDHEELASRPLFFRASGGGVMDTAPDAPFVLTGVMDLVFLESDGWVVADYKSDRLDGRNGVSRDKVRDELTEYYAPQVRLYSRYWERLGGGRVKEAGLYFLSSREWVTVPPVKPAGKKRRR